MFLRGIGSSLLLLVVLCHDMAHGNKDGFNMYKDYLRGRSDEGIDDMRDDVVFPKFLYFYRASPNLIIPVMGDMLHSSEMFSKKNSISYGKRTVNQFKNYMLTREPPEMQFAAENSDSDILDMIRAGLVEVSRPIPVRTSVLSKREAAKEEAAVAAAAAAGGGAQESKRAPAIFSWAVTSPGPRLQAADMSDYYQKMASPRNSASMVERLTSKH